MKKLLTLLLTLSMIFSLVGCNSKKEEPIIDEQPQIEEVIQEETKQEEIIEEEVIVEEPKEEIKTVSKDITNMYFWVTTFDQYGNEVDRYTAKYGSTVYDPNNGKPVTVKGNIKFYVTKNYVSNSNGGGSSSTPTPSPDPDNVNYLYIKNYGSADSWIKFITEGSDVTTYQDLAFQYSEDKQSWTDIVFNTYIKIPVGKTLYFKAKTTNDHVYYYDEDGNYGGVYISDCDNANEYWNDTDFEVGGSVMTLLDPTDTLRDLTGKPGCFYYLFYDFYNLKKADNLVFPATTLSYSCYGESFEDCSYLESINPDLLPATDLSGADYCYYEMFYDCEALQNAPKLPATTLSNYCYEEMFCYCYVLEGPVVLPATTLVNSCYKWLFWDCYLLDNIEVGFSSFDSLTSSETYEWLYNVASTGTFKWPGSLSISPRDESTVPSGWTIIN